ncbi:hypothetical protein PROFUN_05742 [Planoprotostelium fungivorum]|uniref:Uncharacterized protein n=1 Tax=Planoprotostelium fungivorum TaxID=1890364 RepID=A0A2P6NQI9_9EUKA|nr:hypothetical protein PROFUN_05742 [Planoprotostelium fungivorum]
MKIPPIHTDKKFGRIMRNRPERNTTGGLDILTRSSPKCVHLQPYLRASSEDVSQPSAADGTAAIQ